jgi:photosystem II stability/assembly factor-like uncharacterized protein
LRSLNYILALALSLAATSILADEPPKIESSTFGGLKARSIGPAAMGGRIAAIDATSDSPSTVYAGAASGGVWKSTDDGTTYKPVFDDYTQSIGAIAIDPSHTDTVWVGTGESWVRNSVSVGTGVYKSTDAGASWSNAGLGDTEHIARIAVDPKAGDTAYVCATGHAWNSNEERGVFKTTDGGKTWKKILYVDANTGCSDLSLDPQMPNVLFAGMWQFRRQPDFFNSGGPGSGFYKSTDGGAHWTKLTTANGLPAGNLGRIAVAQAPSRPSVIYSLIEAKKTALYRSDDLGEHWKEVNDSFNVTVRPFYFARIVVDPTDYNRVYKPGLSLSYSTDGGSTFAAANIINGSSVHGDHHALWVNPKDPALMFLGTDGGLYESRDRGQHWRHVGVLPVSQFYHVAYDMDQRTTSTAACRTTARGWRPRARAKAWPTVTGAISAAATDSRSSPILSTPTTSTSSRRAAMLCACAAPPARTAKSRPMQPRASRSSASTGTRPSSPHPRRRASSTSARRPSSAPVTAATHGCASHPT